MPKGIAVTRMTPRNLKPEKTWPTAGMGNEKPKCEKRVADGAEAQAAIAEAEKLEPQAMIVPAAMATSPPGTPRK